MKEQIKAYHDFKAIPFCVRYMIDEQGSVWDTKQNKKLNVLSDKNGRRYINLYYEHQGKLKGKKEYIARLLFATFRSNEFNPKLVVRHLNDIASDDRLENLAMGTPADNMRDSVRNGKPRGGRRITDDQIRLIRKLHNEGKTPQEIDRLTHITSANHIRSIIKRNLFPKVH